MYQGISTANLKGFETQFCADEALINTVKNLTCNLAYSINLTSSDSRERILVRFDGCVKVIVPNTFVSVLANWLTSL